jgi:hypothetical protein
MSTKPSECLTYVRVWISADITSTESKGVLSEVCTELQPPPPNKPQPKFKNPECVHTMVSTGLSVSPQAEISREKRVMTRSSELKNNK